MDPVTLVCCLKTHVVLVLSNKLAEMGTKLILASKT